MKKVLVLPIYEPYPDWLYAILKLGHNDNMDDALQRLSSEFGITAEFLDIGLNTSLMLSMEEETLFDLMVRYS